MEGGRSTNETQVLSPLLPSIRSLSFTATLWIIGNIFLALFARGIFGYVFTANTLLSIFLAYVRLKPVLGVGFTPRNIRLEEARDTDRVKATLTFIAALLITIIPLMLVYILRYCQDKLIRFL